MEDIRIPLRIRLRFMKWALVAAAITAAEMAVVTPLCICLVPAPYGFYAALANAVVGLPIGMHFIILVMSGYRERCSDYLRIRSVQLKYPGKPLGKVLMLQMDASLCEREVSRQLRKEFPSPENY